ncbi:MAG: hypothetical protein HY276_07895 [Ignavibacteriales bacterium]|nr:hypothetical protein [Ignavibacteriales bacterium]
MNRTSILDTAKPKQVGESLDKSDDGFSSFFHDNPLAMSITHLSDESLIDVNESFLRLFECTREDVIGYKHSKAISLYDSNHQKIESVIFQGDPTGRRQVSFHSKEDRLKEIAISRELMKSEGDDSALSTYLDITGQKQRDHEFQMLQQEIETFHSASQDLLNPLRHINSFVQLIQKNNPSSFDDMSLRYLKIISESANQMEHLIEDLLTFSRMGKSEIQMTAVNMENLVREVINELGHGTNAQAVEWNLGNLPEVQGDPTMLRVLVNNLILNALKSSLTCRTAKIDIDVLRGDYGHSVFFIHDNGAGFDSNSTDALQASFWNPQSSKEFEGASIRLATVKRIIQRHRGSVWAEATVGQGTTIFFSIPKAFIPIQKKAPVSKT